MSSVLPSVIEELLDANHTITSGQGAAAAGVTRQGAYYHLKMMVQSGSLVREGAGRGARYRRRADRSAEYPIAGLREHQVWLDEYFALKQRDLRVFDNPRVKPILDFVFTEMVNNAIDHSAGSRVTVRWFASPDRISFEVDDDGVGAFRRMRETRGLASDFDAIGEISKGKQTTSPERHSGLGIYFSSRMASRFVLASGHFIWTVDAARNDQAIGWMAKERIGTMVRCEVDAATPVVPVEVFDVMSDSSNAGLARTTIRIALFHEGGFVSRSEAKLIAAHLDVFGTVELDFEGISEVGQGFVDELFRVWQSEHPGTRLVPVRASPAILAMIATTVPIKGFSS